MSTLDWDGFDDERIRVNHGQFSINDESKKLCKIFEWIKWSFFLSVFYYHEILLGLSLGCVPLSSIE